MCLAIPSKVLKIEDNRAIVKSDNHTHKADLSIVKNVKIGDYLLVHGDMALNKIPKKDALKILNFLENRSSHGNSVLNFGLKSNLTREKVIYWLKSEGKEKEALFSEANTIRQEALKEFICIHGIIEFSNYCKNNCLYCGLRKENDRLKRYRMKPEEIVKTAGKAVRDKGYKLLVLQSGEDYFYTDEMLADVVRKIKEKYRVFIFVSVGERGYECYKKLKEAGASGVLFRLETSNPKLFKKLHPSKSEGARSKIGPCGASKNLENRLEHLRFMRDLGYFISTGSLIGLPDQTIEDLADDILMIKKWANMVSMGPFIPTAGTPLEKFQIQNSKPVCNSQQKIDLNLKMIAILRLMMPQARIPVVTALETLGGGEDIRKKALESGANSLMFNLTPAKYRPLYKIYGKKFYQKENFWEKYGLFKYEESYKMLEERMRRELEK